MVASWGEYGGAPQVPTKWTDELTTFECKKVNYKDYISSGKLKWGNKLFFIAKLCIDEINASVF